MVYKTIVFDIFFLAKTDLIKCCVFKVAKYTIKSNDTKLKEKRYFFKSKHNAKYLDLN